jgi:hypothetical protein
MNEGYTLQVRPRKRSVLWGKVSGRGIPFLTDFEKGQTHPEVHSKKPLMKKLKPTHQNRLSLTPLPDERKLTSLFSKINRKQKAIFIHSMRFAYSGRSGPFDALRLLRAFRPQSFPGIHRIKRT